MVSLKRNSKLELVEATGLRSRASSIYTPGQTAEFKISRSKFSNFLQCPRCFYMDRVKGLAEPDMPGWSLNETTDILLKKEFDECREKQSPHRLFDKYNLNHVVPFKHESMDDWRNSKSKGLMHQFENSNIILTGGIDDIWFNTQTHELIVVDYKSQASEKKVETKSYLDSAYHQDYKVQMDFYNYLLDKMGFKIGKISYFLVVNANRLAKGFNGMMEFSETLIPYNHDITWVNNKVKEMIDCMNSNDIPNENISCMNCAYSKARKQFES